MKLPSKSIVMIGFKHVGKTVIGNALADKLNYFFFDLDNEIEKFYSAQLGRPITCREIVREVGEPYFRHVETQLLKKIICTPESVIALGGGAVTAIDNQELISKSEVIYIDAPYDVVHKRIFSGGLPSFFDADKSFEINLLTHWRNRKTIYESLGKIKIYNDKTINDAVNAIISKLLEVQNEGSTNGKSQEATTR